MAPKWDDTFKRLFAASSQDFVQWLMPGATLLEKVPLELKTTTKTRNADVLYKISIDGQEALLHIEFQKRADPMMARRVWEYNVLATLETWLPGLFGSYLSQANERDCSTVFNMGTPTI